MSTTKALLISTSAFLILCLFILARNGEWREFASQWRGALIALIIWDVVAMLGFAMGRHSR